MSTRYKSVYHKISASLSSQLSSFDLQVYLKFDWNPFGDLHGLSSLEAGVGNAEVGSFWQIVAPFFDAHQQADIEEVAYRLDQQGHIDIRTAPSFGADDAAQIGITREEFVEDMFLSSKKPPALADLLSLWTLKC
jgi:hypothetical protein